MIRADRLFLRLNCLCLWLLMAAQMLGQPRMASLLFTMTFFLTLGWWLASAAEADNKLVLTIVILSGLSVCLNALLTQTAVSAGYFKKLIMFWFTVFLLGAVKNYPTDRGDVDFLFRGNAAIACCFLCLYLLRRQQMHLLNGMVTGYLTFRFTNPNLAAVFLAAVSMMELLHFTAASGKRRLLHLFLGTVMAYFVYLTKARNAQLLLAVFLLLFLLRNRLLQRGPGKGASLVLAGLPLWFALGYLLLVANTRVQALFSFLIGEGKGLDSRVAIWRFAMEEFVSAPLTGAYSQISQGTGASQMHNTHLDLLASYGLPVLLLVWRQLAELLEGGSGKGQNLCRGAFFAMLLSGLGEAILFSGGMGIYLYAGIFRVLANFDFEEKGHLL